MTDDTAGFARPADATQLNEPGPQITPAEWSAFQDVYEGLLPSVSVVGPLGQPAAGGAGGRVRRPHPHRTGGQRTRAARHQRGTPLGRGVAARPDSVKPNAGEFAELTGSHEPLLATLDARRRGARAVVASLGPDGLLAVTPEGRWRATPPARVRGNPTGAGALAVAGLLSGLVDQLPWPENLTRAVALSAATVPAPVASEFDRATYEKLAARVRVTGEATAA